MIGQAYPGCGESFLHPLHGTAVGVVTTHFLFDTLSDYNTHRLLQRTTDQFVRDRHTHGKLHVVVLTLSAYKEQRGQLLWNMFGRRGEITSHRSAASQQDHERDALFAAAERKELAAQKFEEWVRFKDSFDRGLALFAKLDPSHCEVSDYVRRKHFHDRTSTSLGSHRQQQRDGRYHSMSVLPHLPKKVFLFMYPTAVCTSDLSFMSKLSP